MSVNNKADLASVRIPHNIDRGIRVVDKLKIFISLRDRRIHGRLDIIDDHRMVVPLRHFQFCPKHRQIQSRRHLTDSSAVCLNDASHLVGSRRSVSVFFGERDDDLLHGEFFSRIEDRAVHQLSPALHILLSVGVAAGVIRAAASESIVNQRQLLRVSLGFVHVCDENHAAVAAMPIGGHVADYLLHRGVRVDHITILSLMNHKTAVLQRQRRIHRCRIHGPRLVFDHAAHCLLIHRKLKFQYFRAGLLQIALYLKTVEHISSLPRVQRLADHIHIRTDKSQFPCRRLHRLIPGIKADHAVLQFFHSRIDCLCDLLFIHTADTDILNVNPLQRRLRSLRLHCMGKSEHGKQADRQRGTALDPLFSHWQDSFLH